VFFSAVKCEKLFFDSGVLENTCFSRNLNHFSGHHPLTPLMHFGNFSLTVFLKKLKKEQFDSSYFCDSRYILMTAVSEMSISLYNNGIDSIK
jgi:hypothetical protein